MERALVTGGAGFIGSHLVRELLARGVTVRVLDNLSSGREENLQGLRGKVDFHQGDIRNAVACRNACQGVDIVFHLAAMVSVPQSVADPVQADAINIGGTLNMLLAARDQKVRRFIFSSSSAVYGDTDVLPTPETVLPLPASPYGVQKLTGEHYARNFTRLYGLETISLRYFNVFGPRQNPDSAYAAVIPKFLSRLVAGQSPIVFGDGEQTRDFLAVQDVVAANLLAAGTDNPLAIGEVFNIAGGQRISLNQLLVVMRDLTGRDIPAEYHPPRPGDILHSGADITRARTLLGFNPSLPLREGLRVALEYYAEQHRAGA
ncbi:MAG: SDR family oxidoreductase [Chloroherpetonaceae bacterium]|nr:SDR family oxidoreductase [Chthonomonadaceae bacterium]MDW8208372.1 SDR family oxidoreductase [Chloroherpetonaceae bacterium]